MKKIYTIEGMGCMKCVKHVEEVLSELPNVTSYKVEIGKVEVIGEIDDQAFSRALEELGYEVIGIMAE